MNLSLLGRVGLCVHPPPATATSVAARSLPAAAYAAHWTLGPRRMEDQPTMVPGVFGHHAPLHARFDGFFFNLFIVLPLSFDIFLNSVSNNTYSSCIIDCMNKYINYI